MMMSSALQQTAETLDRLFGDLAGRQHHPDGARLFRQRLDHIFQRPRRRRALLRRAPRRGLGVRCRTPRSGVLALQPADDVAAHAAQADHAELHRASPDILLIRAPSYGALSSLHSRPATVAEMHAQHAPTAFDQHVEIAARLRRLDNAEAVVMAGHRGRRLVAGDLQEHAGVRAALIGLAGECRNLGAKAEAGGDSPAVAE